jgi:hypothetical protein
LAVRAGELLPREAVERIWSQEITAVRSRLLALPVQWADRLYRAGVKGGAAALEAMLAEMIRDVLTEFSQGAHAGSEDGAEVEGAPP